MKLSKKAVFAPEHESLFMLANCTKKGDFLSAMTTLFYVHECDKKMHFPHK